MARFIAIFVNLVIYVPLLKVTICKRSFHYTDPQQFELMSSKTPSSPQREQETFSYNERERSVSRFWVLVDSGQPIFYFVHLNIKYKHLKHRLILKLRLLEIN